jgi:hypothetical protein
MTFADVYVNIMNSIISAIKEISDFQNRVYAGDYPIQETPACLVKPAASSFEMRTVSKTYEALCRYTVYVVVDQESYEDGLKAAISLGEKVVDKLKSLTDPHTFIRTFTPGAEAYESLFRHWCAIEVEVPRWVT